MARTSSSRTRRRSVNAFDPATAPKAERKQPPFFGPSSAEPFFAPELRRAPEPDEERVQEKPEPAAAEQKKDEETLQAKGDTAPAASALGEGDASVYAADPTRMRDEAAQGKL